MSAFDSVPDEVVQTFATCGTPEESRAQLAEFDGVLDHVILHTPTCRPGTGGQRRYFPKLRDSTYAQSADSHCSRRLDSAATRSRTCCCSKCSFPTQGCSRIQR